ncbi:MAG: gas vesicle protein K [Syntrophales bacterium]|nr:gas vesicle protein K [Syntrophales bacterium]
MMINASSHTQLQEGAKVESPDMSAFVGAMMPRRERQTIKSDRQTPRRLNLDQEKTKNGLAQLVLTVVKLLHELLEKQAIRRIDGGGLTDEEIERLGFTLMRQSEEIARIAREFSLDDDDLNLDLGPLGKLL